MNELGAIAPERILVEYEGLRIFTFRDTAERLLLAYHCDEEGDVWRYTIVPCSERTIERLVAGQVSIASILLQPWGWIADIHDGEIKSLWQVDTSLLPKDYRPQSNVFLTHVYEPDISVRYIGENISERSVPLSIIKTASERVTSAFRGLVDYAGNLIYPSQFSEKESRYLADIPVRGVLLASFQLSIDIPVVQVTNDPETEKKKNLWNEVRRLLNRVVEWSADPELIDSSTTDPEEDVAVLHAIENLAPTGRTDIQEVQLGGIIVSKLKNQDVYLRKETRRRVQSSIKTKVSGLAPARRLRQWPTEILAFGHLMAADKSLSTFYLRDVGPVYHLDEDVQSKSDEWLYGDLILFSYDPLKWKNAVVESFTSERKIAAIGKLMKQAEAPEGAVLAYSIPQYELINLKVPEE